MAGLLEAERRRATGNQGFKGKVWWVYWRSEALA